MQQNNHSVTLESLCSLKKDLEYSQTTSSTTETLIKINQALSQYNVSQKDSIATILYDVIKPISREITNSSIRQISSIKIMEDIIIKIIKLYLDIFCKYQSQNALENLKQLLSRNTFLFIKLGNKKAHAQFKDENLQNSQNIVNNNTQNNKFKWIKQKSDGTQFYRICCQQILQKLSRLPQIFSGMKISAISQYYQLLYWLDNQINQQLLIDIIDQGIASLQNYFSNPSKDLLKQANKDSIDKVSDIIIKILRVSDNSSKKKQVQLLGPQLALTLLKHKSIERKMLGVKLIAKYSCSLIINAPTYLSQSQFARWIQKNQLFDLIYDVEQPLQILKLSNDIFSLFMRTRVLNKQRLQKFLNLIEISSIENRRYLFKLLNNVYIRFDTQDNQVMLNKWSQLKKIDYYNNQQFFNLIQDLVKYQFRTQISKTVQIFQSIIKQYYQQFSNNIKNKCLLTYTKIFSSLLQKNNDSDLKIQDIMKVINNFYTLPSKLTLTIMKKVLQSLPYSGRVSKGKIAQKMIDQSSYLQHIFLILNQKVQLTNQIEQFTKFLLESYKKSCNKKISNQIIIKLTKYPNIFIDLVQFIGQQIQNFFKFLIYQLKIQQFNFKCIREVFYVLNSDAFHKISIRHIQRQYQTIKNPLKMKSINLLQQLLENTQFPIIQQQCAQFIAQLYTYYHQDFSNQGEAILQNYMNWLIKNFMQVYCNYKQGNSKYLCQLRGHLHLLRQLLRATQPFGVGMLRAHNSLVATSTVLIKITNEITQGDDVLKKFQKKFSSNTTLFEVLVCVSLLFKCQPSQIMLRRPSGLQMSSSYNGMILDDLNLNNVPLLALQSHRNRLKRHKLVQGGQLTPRAIQVFKSMYKTFATEGRMGKKQIANYIEGVTQMPCHMHDNRVLKFLQDYDDDKDQNITQQNFLNFYLEKCLQKNNAVNSNLKNLRYRRDLKKYDQPLDQQDQKLMLRYHLAKNQQFYQILFQLINQSNDTQIIITASRLLERLPTYHKIMYSFQDSLSMMSKSQFLTVYILIALQSNLIDNGSQKINPEKQKFIISNKYVQIYNLLIQISHKIETQTIKKCKAIILHILRQLILIPKLTSTIADQKININFQNISLISLPQNDVFEKLISSSLLRIDLQIYEPALVLCLTQSKIDFNILKNAVFHKDKDIRRITCNFLLLWQKKNSYELNLFDIAQQLQCQQWFELLVHIINITPNINKQKLLLQKINKIQSRSQTFQSFTFDPILHGNLLLIKTIIDRHQKINLPQDFADKLITLADRTLSGQNKKIIYSLLKLLNYEKSLNYLSSLIDSVPATKQIQQRQNFVGIKNLGSICYMNSILQQFYVNEQFRNLVMRLPVKNIEKTSINQKIIVDDFLYQLQKLYSYLSLSQKKYYDPTDFCLTIKDQTGKPINTGIQQDAHQFLNTLFTKLQKYMKDSSENNSNQHQKALLKLFGGKTMTVNTCQTCQNQTSNKQQFYHLLLEVQGMSSLKDSLKKYVKPQQINDYFCQVCGKVVPQLLKQTFLNELPQTLIINLQRHIFDLQTFQNAKVHTKHEFTLEIDLKQYLQSDCDQQSQYMLQGVVIHSGTADAGHYYSIIQVDNQWYKFNDQSVTKFDINSLWKQAFGGTQEISQWDQMKFSTNAYILFYTKVNSLKKINSSMELELFTPFSEQVFAQNQQFYKQIQLHQPSFLQFLNDLYCAVKPQNTQKMTPQNIFCNQWYQLPYKDYYKKILDIYIKVMKFVSIFYDFKPQLIFQAGQNIFELFYLLPEQSYQFILTIKTQEYAQIIIAHNQPIIRQLYRFILNKVIVVYDKYYGFWTEESKNTKINSDQIQQQASNEIGNKKLLSILNKFLALTSSQLLMKNVFKCFCFFNFWDTAITYSESILKYALKNQLYGNLLDLMIGPDSPYKSKDEKRIQIPNTQSPPIIQMIIKLQIRKQTLNGNFSEDNFKYPLSEKQRTLLSNIMLYKRVLSGNHDKGMLSPFVAALSFQNKQFSIKIIELLLTNLSNRDSQQTIFTILSHIRCLLLIEDSLSNQRMKWLLGIPQFEASFKYDYCLRDNTGSKIIVYCSNLFFNKSQSYSPLLQKLYDKRCMYDIVTLTGMIFILEALNISQRLRQYLFSIPPPTYNMLTYLDWIENYTHKLQKQSHYGMKEQQKKPYINKLHQLLNSLKAGLAQRSNLPILKYIIGKNYLMNKIGILGAMDILDYQISVWEHQTYVIQNLPTGTSNLSLPSQLFKQGKPQSYARYFVINDFQVLDQNDEIKREKTIITLEIKTKKKLKIIFESQKFPHQIYINKGQIEINMPYDPKPIGQLITVLPVGDEEAIIPNLQIIEQQKFQITCQPPPAPQSHSKDIWQYIQCPDCTYHNFGSYLCQMCGKQIRTEK